MSELVLRALVAGDGDEALALVSAAFAETLYGPRVQEQLGIALLGNDRECRGLVALEPRSPRVSGLALYGDVAGAKGVVKLHALAGSDRAALRALAAALHDASGSARMIVSEIPDDAPFIVTCSILRELGHEEEGRIADFVRDGVSMMLLVKRLTDGRTV
jgi:hypothetical protein